MRWIYGDAFSPAGYAFAWLIWVPALGGVHVILLYAINALGKTKLIALIFFVNLILNVILNLLLVPRFGFLASAALSALCEGLVLLAALWILKRHKLSLDLKRLFWPVVPSTALMALGIWLLPVPQGWETPLWVVLGALFYVAALALFGFFGPEERGHLGRLFGKAT
jgi:O-antigen/teichoic acid export membrane protein